MAKRRLNHEGSLTLRKDGLWVARVSHEGKRIAVYGRTKDEARQKLQAMQQKQGKGLLLVTSQMLLKDYLTGWLGSAKNRIRPSAYDRYEAIIRVHIIPALGQVRIGKLSPEHISRAWDAMLASGKSHNTVRHAHLRLSKSLSDAVNRQLIHLNPCQFVSPPKAYRRELHPPDAEAINRLLSAAGQTEYYEAIHLAFHTGMRRGEVLATRWRDTDLEMATISISRSVYQMKGGNSDYQPTKTGKGQRLVSLTPSSVLVLRALRIQQQADALLFGYSVSPDSLVFRRRDGRPILPDGLSHAFNRLCVKAGLPSFRLHDTRHAHATQMLRQGVHPKIVQERLGHAKVGTTLDIYSHVTPGLQQAAALRFDEGLNLAAHEEVFAQG